MHPFALDLLSFSSLRPFGDGSDLVVRPPYVSPSVCLFVIKLTKRRSKAQLIPSKAQLRPSKGLSKVAAISANVCAFVCSFVSYAVSYEVSYRSAKN